MVVTTSTAVPCKNGETSNQTMQVGARPAAVRWLLVVAVVAAALPLCAVAHLATPTCQSKGAPACASDSSCQLVSCVCDAADNQKTL